VNGYCVGAASVDGAANRAMAEDSAGVRGRHGDVERLSVQSQRVYHQSRKGLPQMVRDRTSAVVPPRG